MDAGYFHLRRDDEDVDATHKDPSADWDDKDWDNKELSGAGAPARKDGSSSDLKAKDDSDTWRFPGICSGGASILGQRGPRRPCPRPRMSRLRKHCVTSEYRASSTRSGMVSSPPSTAAPRGI